MPTRGLPIAHSRAKQRSARVPIAPCPTPLARPDGRLTHPSYLTCAAVAVLCVIVSVTFRLFDTDLWQHLLVGSVIWNQHAVPTRQLWSWPTYGAPDINPSWGFEVLLWPAWASGGEIGLALWRWLTTLAAFALAFATARRMGARGLAPFLIVVIAALVYRQRSQVRPESLVAILLALELWLLETRRRAGKLPAFALLPVLWAWVNIHVSYHIGFTVLAAYALDDTLAVGRGAERGRRLSPLWLVLVAGLVLGLLNPFGWRALWEPFRYFLFERGEGIFRTIGELQPVVWSANWRNGLPLIVLGWPLLALWRLRRRGVDPAELVLCTLFLALPFAGARFVGLLAVVAVPFLARDLSEWLAERGRAWPKPLAVRAALVSAASLGLTVAEVIGSDYEPGIRFDWRAYPVRACDFIAAHDVRGRVYNPFHAGGYLLYRFWPDRGRLPFMDVHASGTTEMRRLTVDAPHDPAKWRALDDRYRFEIALLSRPPLPGEFTADFLDADSTWSLVFLDDAAALYLRRRGGTAAAAERYAYRLLPAGAQRMTALGQALPGDPALRGRLRVEFERQIQESPWNGNAHKLLASIALTEGNLSEARDHLRAAVPLLPREPELARTLRTLERRLGSARAR